MNKRADISGDVLRFISRRIESVPHLETLLLLWEKPFAEWTAEQIAARVYVSHERAGVILIDLLNHGLICKAQPEADRYQYNSAWDQNDLMTSVADSYRLHLVQVASFIHAKAASPAVKDFARAFELKKKE